MGILCSVRLFFAILKDFSLIIWFISEGSKAVEIKLALVFRQPLAHERLLTRVSQTCCSVSEVVRQTVAAFLVAKRKGH